MKKNKEPSNFASKFWGIWLAILVLSGIVMAVCYLLREIPELSNLCSKASSIAGSIVVLAFCSYFFFPYLVMAWAFFVNDGKLVWERIFVAAVVIFAVILLVNVGSEPRPTTDTENPHYVSAPSDPEPAEDTENTYYVYITNTGEKYHRAGCQYLSQSKRMISLEAARQRGYTACSRCW